MSLRPHRWLLSIIIGFLVFVLWIGPELMNPHYRQDILFSNMIVGSVGSSLRPEALSSNSVLFWRTVRASTVVPVAEELFWRAWLMRWIINSDFQKVPLGAYSALAFWVTALLFAAEHGPYWDVGLLAGIIYNVWMLRSKSLGDCIVMHAVTNLVLSLYVIRYGQWQYWQ
jgi:CAAX prenyl protease-like protein